MSAIIEAPEPDIIALLLAQVAEAVPGFTPAASAQIERDMRANYGGQRVRICKRGKYLTAEQKSAAFTDGLTNKPTAEITQTHKISRRSLYRIMKTGGRFD